MRGSLSTSVLVGAVLIGVTAPAAVCREYGCSRYANPNGWCSLHQPEGAAYRAKKAAEAAADRRIIAEHDALERLHDEEDARVKADAAARLRRLEARQRKQLKIEQKKFEQPLEGIFGRKFGESAPSGETAFAPSEPFRGFKEYVVRAEGTNGVVRIGAHADFPSEEAMRRESDEVLANLGARYGRTPYKLFTKNGEEVWALGFGGVGGMARQQLQVTLTAKEKCWRIDLVAFVIRHPKRALVSESEATP